MTAAVDDSTLARAGEVTGSKTHDGTFVLESRGWSSPSESCAPKIAALASLASLAEPLPVASVGYVSRGNLLVIAGAEPQRARLASVSLARDLAVTLLEPGVPPVQHGVAPWSGRLEAL